MKNNRNIFFFKMILLHTIVLACSILMITGQNALSQPISVTGTAPMIRANDWSLYSEKFLSKEGRIMDDANGNISHSEGQGYGLLLAFLAGKPADFELIWSFTQTEMLIRNDGLSAWKWDPAVRPYITDTNNASDGDILIAYSLALAGRKWGNADYLKSATTIAATLLKKQITNQNGETILLPAIRGFTHKEREDGPVINLSYWVFETFPVFNELVPSPRWSALTQSGLNLLQKSRFGKTQLPSDWISIHKSPEPAKSFPPEFGYNNVRIVLYLSRAGFGKEALTQQLAKAMTGDNGNITLVNVTTNAIIASLSEPGYKIIPQLAACISRGTKLSKDVSHFTPTHYYSSTLHLLALSYAGQKHPECL
ncbi:endoglucanase [Ochrobactrum sp. MR28]|nr:endoglucanase [Ochrobactrum sp. MR28]MBX8818653.1 endoglucanase [Ochrobactrum sp. MR31]